ncbi:hypothetical protein Tco_0469156 [Tanacetum coccineum]
MDCSHEALIRVTKLDPIPEFIGPWGRFGDPRQPFVVHLGNGERSGLTGFQLAREHLQSRVKEEDLITNVENAVFDLGFIELNFFGDHPRSQGQSLHASRPNRLCARARSVDDMPFRIRACMGCSRWVYCKRRERPHEIDAPHVKDFANLDGILRHFITLRNFSLTLTSVTLGDQVMGIFVNSGPKETGIKDLFGSEICTMMSPGGSIVASFEDVESFFAVYTPPDHLIRTTFEQLDHPKVCLTP